MGGKGGGIGDGRKRRIDDRKRILSRPDRKWMWPTGPFAGRMGACSVGWCPPPAPMARTVIRGGIVTPTFVVMIVARHAGWP